MSVGLGSEHDGHFEVTIIGLESVLIFYSDIFVLTFIFIAKAYFGESFTNPFFSSNDKA